MLAKSKTCAVVGLDGYIVEVEVDISPGLPTFIVVGLPDAAVKGGEIMYHLGGRALRGGV